jgi:hypothetical protein
LTVSRCASATPQQYLLTHAGMGDPSAHWSWATAGAEHMLVTALATNAMAISENPSRRKNRAQLMVWPPRQFV